MDTVTIPRGEYEALVAAHEELEDILAYDRGITDEQLPAAFVERMLAGESPVRLWREHRGLTQQALADSAGLHRVNLAKIESGARGASVASMAKLAAALGVTVDDLI
jgi:DNA-binding XRE family transcriptional regulator